jgi:hypothetical protein
MFRLIAYSGWPEIGDGYGFPIETLPDKSPTTMLKLHGSTSWLALLLGGMTYGFSQFQPGATLSPRPVIPKNELSFLGYPGASDPMFPRGGAAMPVMIFPTKSKDFYFAPNTGIEYAGFWDHLWGQAEKTLAIFGSGGYLRLSAVSGGPTGSRPAA